MQAFFLQNRSNLGSSKNYRQLFISNKTFSPVLFSICVSIRPSPPHKGSMREQETQCEWEGMSCFQTRLAPPRGLGDVRHRLCPKLPLPLNTHTLSFLIETFHSLPCKHPARLAGAQAISPSASDSASEQYSDSCLHFTCCLHLAGSQESDSSQTAKKDMLAALRARQEALEETLKQRLEELKSICIREAVSENNCLNW